MKKRAASPSPTPHRRGGRRSVAAAAAARAAAAADREFVACFRAYLRTEEEIDRLHGILANMEAKQDRRHAEIVRLHRRASDLAKIARSK